MVIEILKSITWPLILVSSSFPFFGQIGMMVLKVEFKSNFMLHDAGSFFTKVWFLICSICSISESVK